MNRITARRDVIQRCLVMIGDLLVCHRIRQHRSMDSGDLAVEAGKKTETSGGTPWVNH
jgi:hypothetical protein